MWRTRARNAEELSLCMLSVDPEHRERGVGRVPREGCKTRARPGCAERVALHTGEQLVAARRLY
jgi:GNAT superfamily N-acetyltransferase